MLFKVAQLVAAGAIGGMVVDAKPRERQLLVFRRLVSPAAGSFSVHFAPTINRDCSYKKRSTSSIARSCYSFRKRFAARIAAHTSAVLQIYRRELDAQSMLAASLCGSRVDFR